MANDYFSSDFEASLLRARDIVGQRGGGLIGTQHLLLALTYDREAITALSACDVDIQALRMEVLKTLGDPDAAIRPWAQPVSESRTILTVMAGARNAAQTAIHDKALVNGVHALYAILICPRPIQGAELLAAQGLTPDDMWAYLEKGQHKTPGPGSNRRRIANTGVVIDLLPMTESLKKEVQLIVKVAGDIGRPFLTVEHLLLALTEERDAAACIQHCHRNTLALRTGLYRFLDGKEQPDQDADEQKAAAALVLDRLNTARFSDHHRITGADMLLTIIDETDGFAKRLLERHGIDRRAVADYIARGDRPFSPEGPRQG